MANLSAKEGVSLGIRECQTGWRGSQIERTANEIDVGKRASRRGSSSAAKRISCARRHICLPRDAPVGSTAAVLRAGITAARSASAKTPGADGTSTAGSDGLTWRGNAAHKIRRERGSHQLDGRSCFAPEISTRRTMFPCCQPSAMRIANLDSGAVTYVMHESTMQLELRSSMAIVLPGYWIDCGFQLLSTFRRKQEITSR